MGNKFGTLTTDRLIQGDHLIQVRMYVNELTNDFCVFKRFTTALRNPKVLRFKFSLLNCPEHLRQKWKGIFYHKGI